MKQIFYFFAATLVLAAVGCSKDDATIDDVQYVSELKVKFEGDTRVGYTHDTTTGLKFAWEEDDMLLVYKKGEYSSNFLNFRYNASTETFEGVNVSDVMEVGQEYTALYGIGISFVAADQINGKLTSPATLAQIPMVSDTFTATNGATIATMHHLVGVIEIPVKATIDGKKLTHIEVNMFNDPTKKLCGNFRISQSAPKTIIPVDGISYNNQSQTFDPAITLSASEATSIFIPVFPVSGGIVQIDYKFEGDVAERSMSRFDEKTLTVVRGEITKIKEVILD